MELCRKKGKGLDVTAYAPEEDEILAFAMGKRNAEMVRRLMLKLKQLTIHRFLNDDWEAFQAMLPSEKTWLANST